MKVTLEIKKHRLIANLSGELDHHAAAKVREEIDSAIDSNDIKVLIFNFDEVSFMDSSGVGVIMGRYNKMKSSAGRTVVTNCNEYIDKLLDMSGVFTIVEKYADIEYACEEIGVV